MKKVYTIGRDPSCDIVVNDSTDVVSRVHASLKDIGHGRYILVDQSRNGTYVNGIRMSSNEEVPVTRKDVINFAHAQDLDWEQVPRPRNGAVMWLLVALGVVLVGGLTAYFLTRGGDNPSPAEPPAPMNQVVTPPDSVTLTEKEVRTDTVFIKAEPKRNDRRKAREQKPKKEEPKEKKEQKPEKKPEKPAEDKVIDAIY